MTSIPMEWMSAYTNLTTRLWCLISIVGVLLQKESTIIYAPINIVNHNIANYGQLKTQSLSFPRHLENTSPGCFSVTVPPEGATNGKGQCAAVTFPKCLIQFYQAPTNGSHVVWWNLSLLLLTTSASICLQHSLNHVRTINGRPV